MIVKAKPQRESKDQIATHETQQRGRLGRGLERPALGIWGGKMSQKGPLYHDGTFMGGVVGHLLMSALGAFGAYRCVYDGGPDVMVAALSALSAASLGGVRLVVQGVAHGPLGL